MRWAALLLVAGCSHVRPVAAPVQRVCIDGKRFVTCQSREPLVIHGFNYDHDRSFRLIEDYWTDRDTISLDLAELRLMRANTVRLHLQFGRFMRSADQPDEHALAWLDWFLRQAELQRLHVLITGLGSYRPQDAPAWYDALDDAGRWQAQARFWEAVASRAAASAATFGYDLMNEPVVPGEPQPGWAHEAQLDGLHFIQFITRDRAGRAPGAIVHEWASLLSAAIRRADPHALITIGLLPAYRGFELGDVAPLLDFESVHLYPRSGHFDEAAGVISAASGAWPVLVEESAPIDCSVAELAQFMTDHDPEVAGWLGFYWGEPVVELESSNEPKNRLLAEWLKVFGRR